MRCCHTGLELRSGQRPGQWWPLWYVDPSTRPLRFLLLLLSSWLDWPLASSCFSKELLSFCYPQSFIPKQQRLRVLWLRLKSCSLTLDLCPFTQSVMSFGDGLVTRCEFVPCRRRDVWTFGQVVLSSVRSQSSLLKKVGKINVKKVLKCHQRLCSAADDKSTLICIFSVQFIEVVAAESYVQINVFNNVCVWMIIIIIKYRE